MRKSRVASIRAAELFIVSSRSWRFSSTRRPNSPASAAAASLTGRSALAVGGVALWPRLVHRPRAAEAAVGVGGAVVALVALLPVSVQSPGGMGPFVGACRDRVGARRELALAHAGAERAGQLNEL